MKTASLLCFSSALVLGVLSAGCTQTQNLGDQADGGTDGAVHSSPDQGSSGNHAIVLYGGADETSNLDDTWVFDGTSWTQQQVTGPGARSYAQGASYNGNAILFGGDNGVGDTWSWNGSAWTQLSTSGPPPRTSAAMMATTGGLILFGGNVELPTQPTPADTWLFTGTTWTQQNVVGPINGLDWVGATLNGVGWMFEGDAVDSWNGTSWSSTQVLSGGPNADNGASSATLGNSIVYFGGYTDDFNVLGATWTFDGTNWTLHNISGAAPSARAFAGLATLGDKVVLFGGEVSGGIDQPNPRMGDTWVFDGTTWTELNIPGPSARSPAVMIGY